MSLNPIQFGRDVLDQYGRYLLTTFRLSDPRLAGQLRSGLAYGPGTGDRSTIDRGSGLHRADPCP